jgi:pimeloyl-ACP methyl ester carboxylesterase
MRARDPDADGYVERDGVKLFYEVFGEGSPTVFLLPTWSIIHSRHWKAQIPYLSRHFRVVTFDGRGNGGSDRPLGAEAYLPLEFAKDAIAVMDATDTAEAVIISLSAGANWALAMAAYEPQRVLGAAFIGPAVPFGPSHVERAVYSFDDVLDTDVGWAKYNRHYWQRDYRGFL